MYLWDNLGNELNVLEKKVGESRVLAKKNQTRSGTKEDIKLPFKKNVLRT